MATYKRGSGNYKSSFMRVKIKTVGQGRTSTVTLQDDDELKFTIKKDHRYFGFARLLVKAHADADFKLTFKATVGGAAYQTYSYESSAVVAPIAFGSSKTYTTDDTVQTVSVQFWVKPTADADLILQWAQVTSDANSTNVQEGSMLVIFEA